VFGVPQGGAALALEFGRVLPARLGRRGAPAVVVDVGFLALIVAAAVREIVAGANWRNLRVVALVAPQLAGNRAFHVEARLNGAPDYSVGVVVMLVALIGGRIIPSFTRNWLARGNPGRPPSPFGPFDVASLAISAAALSLWVFGPDGPLPGTALGLAGLLHLAWLGRWAGDRTSADRLVLILHVGYFFVPLGFLPTAAAAFGVLPGSAGLHAWMTGAAGIMTLAMMTRARLGHTGRPLVASPAIEPARSDALLHLAAGAWTVAFLGFGCAFGPVLLRKPKRSRWSRESRMQ
jgi:uncharacterized protein involved in response to NO